MAETIRVRGLRELNAAFRQVDRETRLGLRKELANIAEPIRMTAETLATQRISGIGPMRARSWARMRIGVLQKVVYVAPKQRGRRSSRAVTEQRKRADRKFATRLMDQAMIPALAQHETETVRRVEIMLDRVADRAGF